MGDPNIDYEKLQHHANTGQEESAFYYDMFSLKKKKLTFVPGLQAKEIPEYLERLEKNERQ